MASITGWALTAAAALLSPMLLLACCLLPDAHCFLVLAQGLWGEGRHCVH